MSPGIEPFSHILESFSLGLQLKMVPSGSAGSSPQTYHHSPPSEYSPMLPGITFEPPSAQITGKDKLFPAVSPPPPPPCALTVRLEKINKNGKRTIIFKIVINVFMIL